jgi:hypothetical protein
VNKPSRHPNPYPHRGLLSRHADSGFPVRRAMVNWGGADERSLFSPRETAFPRWTPLMRITPDERTDKCNEQLHKLSTVGFYGVLAVTFQQ